MQSKINQLSMHVRCSRHAAVKNLCRDMCFAFMVYLVIDGKDIVYHDHVNISVAVSAPKVGWIFAFHDGDIAGDSVT